MRPLCRERPTHPVQPHLPFPRWMDVARAPVCREEPCSCGGGVPWIWPTHGRNGKLPAPLSRRHNDAFGRHCPPKRQHRSCVQGHSASSRANAAASSTGWLAGRTWLVAPPKAPAGVFARGSNLSDPVRASPHGVVGHGSLGGRWLQKERHVSVRRRHRLGPCMLDVRGSSRSIRSTLHPRPATASHHPGPPRALCPSPHGRPRHEATRGSHVENPSPVLADQATHIQGVANPSRTRGPCARHLWESGRHHSMGLVQALAWPRQPARSLRPCGFRARHEAPRDGRGVALPYLAHFR